MIIDALTNPPVPEWNELGDAEKEAIRAAWEMYSCPHSCGGDALHVYSAIRKALKARERRIFQATMDGPLPLPPQNDEPSATLPTTRSDP
jgi:hypothetical protein